MLLLIIARRRRSRLGGRQPALPTWTGGKSFFRSWLPESRAALASASDASPFRPILPQTVSAQRMGIRAAGIERLYSLEVEDGRIVAALQHQGEWRVPGHRRRYRVQSSSTWRQAILTTSKAPSARLASATPRWARAADFDRVQPPGKRRRQPL